MWWEEKTAAALYKLEREALVSDFQGCGGAQPLPRGRGSVSLYDVAKP